mmetsp:Transcript_3577/g.11576  ORF Transcript_3577/g.11576 Transcript_3577/m.11576 type:complete len:272 (-) Transcript_3577:46-861(-)
MCPFYSFTSDALLHEILAVEGQVAAQRVVEVQHGEARAAIGELGLAAGGAAREGAQQPARRQREDERAQPARAAQQLDAAKVELHLVVRERLALDDHAETAQLAVGRVKVNAIHKVALLAVNLLVGRRTALVLGRAKSGVGARREEQLPPASERALATRRAPSVKRRGCRVGLRQLLDQVDGGVAERGERHAAGRDVDVGNLLGLQRRGWPLSTGRRVSGPLLLLRGFESLARGHEPGLQVLGRARSGDCSARSRGRQCSVWYGWHGTPGE